MTKVFPMKASLTSTLDEVLELFLTNQPTGLIADELVRSSQLYDLAEKGGALFRALRSAEKNYGTNEFWQSPPHELAFVIAKTRSAVSAANTRDQKIKVLFDLISESNPAFLN
jgi:hypothetical protein